MLSAADLLATAAPSPSPFHFTGNKLPYKARWGSYIVSVPSQSTVRVADSSGRVLKEIQAPFIDTVDYPDMSGHGDCEELRVVTAPGNNTLGDWRTYCFSRAGGLHPILEMQGITLDAVQALDQDARPELLVDDAGALEWIDPVSHASCPDVRLVLRWDGRRYVIANRRFPKVIWSKANWYRRECSRAWRNERADWALGAAFGYWANLAMIGQEASARKWVLSNLPDGMQERFIDELPQIRKRLGGIPEQINSRLAR